MVAGKTIPNLFLNELVYLQLLGGTHVFRVLGDPVADSLLETLEVFLRDPDVL